MSDQNLEVRGRAVGPWPMNSYVLVCPHTRQSAQVDPGADPEALQQLLSGTTPVAILLTHTHPDHVGALDQMREALGVPLVMHPGPHFQGAHYAADLEMADGAEFKVGAHTLVARYAPGHIDDMICFEVKGEPIAIVGDTIFEGGPGRTASPEAFRTTLDTLRHVVLAWPDETICYPGHGPSFRLGDVRARVEAFVARQHGDFYGDATWDQKA
jgi:glyoxylase-like metal-dependent hydrolase (beta-lactamase superfamily II)